MSIQLKGNSDSSFSDDVVIGGGNISLNADGSITAAGRINSGEFTSASTTTAGVRLQDNGQIVIQKPAATTPGSRAYRGFLGDVETFAVESRGNILVGGDLTSTTTPSPNISLNATDGSATFADGKILLNPAGQVITNSQNNSVGDKIFKVNAASAEKFYVSGTGQLYAKATSIVQITSERRLKENIKPIDANVAWDTIKSTPYYEYKFKDSESITYGPMADEVPTEMVVQPMEENEAGVMVARSDEEGPIRTYDNGMLQARLYTALQTALTRIEALEANLYRLKAALIQPDADVNTLCQRLLEALDILTLEGDES